MDTLSPHQFSIPGTSIRPILLPSYLGWFPLYFPPLACPEYLV